MFALGGSVARGNATSTSDLDITVLLPGPPAPFRESLQYDAWPVELFVHTEESLAHFCAKDKARRQPTLMRLVGESIILLDTDGSGARLQEMCRQIVADGPDPLSAEELALRRYRITDGLEDLRGTTDDDERLAIASALWRDAAELLLAGDRRWIGTSKGLLREVTSYDEECGTRFGVELMDGVRAAATSDVVPLVDAVERIEQRFGGPLFEGFRLDA